MAIFICPECGHKQKAPDAYAGRVAKCAKCDTKGTVLEKEPPIQVSVIENSARGNLGRRQNFSFGNKSELETLRSMADIASSWLVAVLTFNLVISWIGQVGVVGYFLSVFVANVTGGTPSLLETAFPLLAIPVLSLAIWIGYFLLKIQLGMVAAVLLIERNTRGA